MNIIKLQVKNFEITPLEKQYVVENQVNEFAIEFEFDDSWDYETKYVIFDNEETTYKRPIINNQVIVPSELLNGRTTIQIYGQNVENGEIVKRKPSYKYSFSILNSLSTDGQEESDLPTPSQWEVYIQQVQDLCNDLQSQFDDLKEDCETKCNDVVERLAEAEQDIQTNTDNIRANAEAIDKLNTDLLDYSLVTETGNKISMSINPNTYVITLSLKDKNDNILSTQSVDLPLETMIVSASYSNGVLTFTLKNGQTLQVPIGDLISGLVSTDTFNQAVQGLSNRITTIENDYLKSSDKTELQNQITANADDISDIKGEQLTQNADIESLQQENERLSRIVSGLPTKNASGTNIVLNDMVKCEIKEISLKGDTLQDGTPTPSSPIDIQSVTGDQTIQCCGKNLFDKNSITNSCWLVENGTISTEHPGYDVSDYIPITPNTQYYKGKNGSPRNKYYDENKQALDTSTYQDISIGGEAGTFTTPNNAHYLRITINEANADINNLQLEKGNVATPYEEYQGTNYQVSLASKNLFNINDCLRGYSYNYGAVGTETIRATAPARITLSPQYAIKVKPNTKYTFNMNITDFDFAVGELRSDKKTNGDSGWQNGSITITTKSNTKYIVFNFRKKNDTQFIPITDEQWQDFLSSEAQLELGEQSTPFVQYSIIELCKIGKYQDKIYKSNDKWLLEKNIGKFVLNGTQNITYSAIQGTTLLVQVNLNLGNLKPNEMLSNLLPYREDNWNTKLETIGIGGVYNNLLQIILNTDRLESNDVAGFNKFVSENNLIIYLQLKTPTITEITDDNLINQLEALNNYILLTNNTIISNGNLPVINDVTGYVDIMSLLSTQNNRNVVEEKKVVTKSVEEPIEEPIEDDNK